MSNVRVAVTADIPQLVDAYSWLSEPPGAKPAGWDPIVAADRLKRTIAGPDTGVLVVVEGATVIGFCTTYLDLESVRLGQRCWVEDLAVVPGRCSDGIGAALLSAARIWARASGATHLELDSSTARAEAHRSYNRHEPASHSVNFGWQTA
ncbi:GNAT family N-acetyltransferase [Streptomyces sp. SID13031]|uniref:GNAT family N-acetyltransferase n=1 Tax=Streptomyces sp. SID13031 TaxID=2706046 RepID=UPI0013C77574|nr:GNAT family N-acetyltransferase [Streptomyces sp. SID13031]NEA31683.1 GNAT family N-acetyltransferase [Streptomyces sp. SID13031]